MIKLRHILTLALLSAALESSADARPESSPWVIESLTPQSRLEYEIEVVTATGGVIIKYEDTVLTADRVSLNQQTGVAMANGQVRIQRDDQIWAGEHIAYNFKTRRIEAEEFQTGKAPIFAEGRQLRGDVSNRVYTARSAYITTDDVDQPFTKIRASSITIIPGKSFQARNAVLFLGDVPFFYFPFYYRNLDRDSNSFTFTPGYRSRFGPFLLGSYRWFLNEQLDGTLHLDYRLKRGVGAGPDVNAHLGRWGEVTLNYYYLHDEEPSSGLDTNITAIPHNRQRFYFGYDASPFTNFSAKAVVRYQKDPRVIRDFFENEYRQNPQPGTFVELNKFWSNFSLDAYVQPRINDFFETVERLPEVKLTGFRQQLGASPLFYESESSAGYYRRRFAETNGPPLGLDYAATRADTYHELLLPRTLFGWLNVAPRVGGRLSYYGSANGDGGTNSEIYRGVFNTGAEVSFKAWRVWPGVTNGFLALDGLRHILEPSANYVFVPTPRRASDLPRFDYELPSLRLLPIDFPNYNSIDSIDSQNVIRWGLRNKLQTKRDGMIQDLLRWDLYTDWRLRPRDEQTTFADLYSDLLFRPRSWITLESQTRYDIDTGTWRMSFHNLTLQPNDTWSWSGGHWYLRDDFSASPLALGQGNNLITSTLFYKLNENWAFRAGHHFEARDGRLEEQNYTVYRDLRSWTAAVTFRLRDSRTGSDDYTIAFTFSLKASPRFGLGSDAVRPYQLLSN